MNIFLKVTAPSYSAILLTRCTILISEFLRKTTSELDFFVGICLGSDMVLQ